MSKQLIIIIGLPCSGKTTLLKKYQKKYEIFDDFIDNFINYELMKNIKLRKKICICDPRLCDTNIFNFYIEIFRNYLELKNIFLILYKNEPKKCLINNMNNNYNDIIKKKIKKSIYKLTKIYDLKNYINYQNIVISVYIDSK